MDQPIVVTTEWLRDNSSDPSLTIVDVRPPYFYTQGHIPGALNVPVFMLSGAMGALPPPQSIAQRLGAIGITRGSHIVAYDGGSDPSAALFFWILSYYGHPAVSVLDGGVTKWRHDGNDWEYASAQPEPSEYRVGEMNPEVLASIDDVRSAVQSSEAVIVDVRSPREYLGHDATAQRVGHIPGAVNIEWSNNLTVTEDGLRRLRAEDELRALYEMARITPDKQVIVHCQSGARAAETFMALKTLGYPRVANYAAGWQEWGNRSDTDIAEE